MTKAKVKTKTKIFKTGFDFLSKAQKELEEIREGIVPRFKLEAGEKTKVRFLYDAEQFVQWYAHSLVKRSEKFYKSIPCISDEDVCPLCNYLDGKIKWKRFKFVTYIWNYGTSRVEQLNKGITVMQDLVAFHEEYGTVTDRDYRVTRRGKGLDTEYHFVPLAGSKFGEKVDLAELPPFDELIRTYTKEEIDSFISIFEAFTEKESKEESIEEIVPVF